MTITYVTSDRAPRHVAHATCPSCGTTNIGITFHGVLSSGAKVYWLAVHSPGYRSRRHKGERCEGSQMRMAITAEGWSPAA